MKNHKSRLDNKLFVIISGVLILTMAANCGSKDQPGDKSGYHEIGMALFREGFLELLPKGKTDEAMKKFAEAEKAFKQAVAMNPESAESHRYLARAYSMQNKLSPAAAEYLRAIEIEPNNMDNHLFLSSIYVRMKRYDDALKVLNHARTLTSESAAIRLIDDLIHNIKKRSFNQYHDNTSGKNSSDSL